MRAPGQTWMADDAALPVPVAPSVKIPMVAGERRAPVWPWVAGAIVALLLVAGLLLKRRTG